jgi:hypothetical protein
MSFLTKFRIKHFFKETKDYVLNLFAHSETRYSLSGKNKETLLRSLANAKLGLLEKHDLIEE